MYGPELVADITSPQPDIPSKMDQLPTPVDTPVVDQQSKFKNFLNQDLPSFISCPISGSTFCFPVLGEDGFAYEETVFKDFLGRSHSPLSPITREKINKKYYPVKFLQRMIDFSDKYDLDASKDKFINNDSFEENFEVILSNIINEQYDYVYKFKKFTLSIDRGMFCQKMMIKPKNKNAYVDCIKYILDNSVDINFVTPKNSNIFHVFFMACREPELIDYIFHIFDKETIDKMVSHRNNDNRCAVHCLISNSDEMVTYVCDKYIVSTPIYLINDLIARNINITILKKLISNHPNINEFDDSDKSLMFIAIRHSNLDIVKFLIEKGYDMKNKSNGDYNAFHYAAQCRHSQISRYVLDQCDNFDEESANGHKIIHLAARHNNYDVIMHLLEKFVDLTTLTTGQQPNYSAINLIEMNNNLSDDQKDSLFDYMMQLLTVQYQ